MAIELLVPENDEREPHLTREHAREVVGSQQAALNENLTETPAGPLALAQGVGDLFLAEEACSEDQRAERRPQMLIGRRDHTVERSARPIFGAFRGLPQETRRKRRLKSIMAAELLRNGARPLLTHTSPA